MVCFPAYLLPLAALCSQLVTALPSAVQTSPNVKVGNAASVFDHTDKYPMPNHGKIAVHDPNILEHNNAFYLFKGGVHVPVYKATDMNGPWKSLGTVLEKDSIIPNYDNATRPWAPTTVEWKSQFYCFYTLSQAGKRHSAIGVASTKDIEKGPWTDHGALITTKSETEGSPYNVSNAIDASFVVDKAGNPYLNYGSYWTNIWQVPLEDDLLSVKGNTAAPAKAPKKQKGQSKNKDKSDKKSDKKESKGEKRSELADKDENKAKGVQNLKATHLTFMPGQDKKPEEGSWISSHDGYYYLWFSHGKCCNFEKDGFPTKGEEYSIRVGRSKNSNGPFEDQDGHELLKSGGTVIYGSNHGLVYAPGGLGVLPGNDKRRDILYYHYLDTKTGFKHQDAQLGWNYLEYKNGWPVAVANKNDNKDTSKTSKTTDAPKTKETPKPKA